MLTNPICADIVTSITRLCRARNMASVAEFVETEAQAAILREQGCDIFQGYLYSKALQADDCLEFIRRNHATRHAPFTRSPEDVRAAMASSGPDAGEEPR